MQYWTFLFYHAIEGIKGYRRLYKASTEDLKCRYCYAARMPKKKDRSNREICDGICDSGISGFHTEKSFLNLVKSNRNQIVFTIFRLISSQTDVRLVPNQSENGNYNLISVWFNKILKRFLCVWGGFGGAIQSR